MQKLTLDYLNNVLYSYGHLFKNLLIKDMNIIHKISELRINIYTFIADKNLKQVMMIMKYSISRYIIFHFH